MKTIVALVDFSDVATNVLKHVLILAQPFKSQVIVLHGIPVRTAVIDVALASPAIPQEPTEADLQADMARLQKLTEPLRACGLGVTLKQFHGTTIERVVEEALRSGADLIVVGSHRHNSFYNLLVGSVTNQILTRAKCPVLVVSAE
jgi:nucleotide-binding universal stress UspA family protein